MAEEETQPGELCVLPGEVSVVRTIGGGDTARLALQLGVQGQPEVQEVLANNPGGCGSTGLAVFVAGDAVRALRHCEAGGEGETGLAEGRTAGLVVGEVVTVSGGQADLPALLLTEDPRGEVQQVSGLLLTGGVVVGASHRGGSPDTRDHSHNNQAELGELSHLLTVE